MEGTGELVGDKPEFWTMKSQSDGMQNTNLGHVKER